MLIRILLAYEYFNTGKVLRSICVYTAVIYFFVSHTVYFSWTVHIKEHYCKYGRIKPEVSCHLSSLARRKVSNLKSSNKFKINYFNLK